MKVQDTFFFAVFLLLLLKRNPRLYAFAGLLCLILAIPLFTSWIFFTAERLTWYAGAFLAASALLWLISLRKVQ